MALETISEAKIWTYPTDGSCPKKRTFNLARLLLEGGSSMIIGVKPLPKDQAELNRLISNEINKRLQTGEQKNFDQESREDAHKFFRENYCIMHPSDFRAFRLAGAGQNIDDLPQVAMTDRRWLALASLDTKVVTVLPFDTIGPLQGLFSDAYHKITPAIWSYDGNLKTALEEFHQRKFAFNLAQLPTTKEYSAQRGLHQNNNRSHRIDYDPIEYNATLDKVLTIISEEPKL